MFGDNSANNQQAQGMNFAPVIFLARCGAVSMEVFLHRSIGCRYLGLQAAAAMLLIPGFGLFWPADDQGPLMCLLAAYLFMCLAARMDMAAQRRRGTEEHSLYGGYPWLMKLCPKASEEAVKRFIEPLLVLMAAGLTSDFNQPLSNYFLFAAICLFVSANLNALWFRTRAVELNDAVIEQQVVAERFRQMQRRW
jgi:hypothetical protein